jgi:chromosome segregation ATPase
MAVQQDQWKKMVNTQGDSLLKQELQELQAKVEQYEELLAKVNHQPADQQHRIAQLEQHLQAELTRSHHIEHERQQLIMELKDNEQTQLSLEQSLAEMEQQLREKEQLLNKLAEREDDEEEERQREEEAGLEKEWRERWHRKEEEERR